jgi:hypothetical protein
MNDYALGKRLVEEMTMEVIETCFPVVTGGPALYRMRRLIDNDLAWLDRSETSFSEIWLMDTSAEFFSFQDARKAADLYCLWPPEKRGFYEQDRTREPFA